MEAHLKQTSHLQTIVLGTRGSKLALVQGRWIADRLRGHHPHVDVQVKIVHTQGDILHDASLTQIGGTGVFVKEIETLLLASEIDLAVHSLKDLPLQQPPGLTIGAICCREDSRDVLLTNGEDGLDALPHCAVVGTGSLRRKAQLLAYRPDLTIRDIRGNVDTRLRKLHEGQYDAIVLAAAGLKRLGHPIRESQYVPFDVMLPAIGQGALAVEIREHDPLVTPLVAWLNDSTTEAATAAEMAFLAALGGGCTAPIGAYAQINGEHIVLEGMVAELNGRRLLRDKQTGPLREAQEVGRALGIKLLARGADELIASV